MEQGVYLSHCVRRTLPFWAVLFALWSTAGQSQESMGAQATACPTFAYASPQPPASTPAIKPEQPRTDSVVARLEPGLLKPQVETLIKQGFAVEHIDWRASPHYRWSTHFEFPADGWQNALRKILQPYQLQLTLYANRTAVVAPAAEVR